MGLVWGEKSMESGPVAFDLVPDMLTPQRVWTAIMASMLLGFGVARVNATDAAVDGAVR